jgi:hypothetical protein
MRWFWLVIGCLILLVGVVSFELRFLRGKGVPSWIVLFSTLVDLLMVGGCVVTWPWEVAHLTEEIAHTLFRGIHNLFQFLLDVLVSND